ncbi:MAG: hypothetical protein ACTHXO_08930 [Actinomycetaceae bacterium]
MNGRPARVALLVRPAFRGDLRIDVPGRRVVVDGEHASSEDVAHVSSTRGGGAAVEEIRRRFG